MNKISLSSVFVLKIVVKTIQENGITIITQQWDNHVLYNNIGHKAHGITNQECIPITIVLVRIPE